MDNAKCQSFVNNFWDQSIIPTLKEFITIPNKSPLFDPHWQAHGYMDQAINLVKNWCLLNAVDSMKLEVLQDDSKTPVILIDIPGSIDKTVLLYGHIDKQPEMVGWDNDLGPWKPVIKDNKLYGRGGADDGYAVFASLTAIKALKIQNLPHPRCLILIEASEESGSPDLPYYIEKLKNRFPEPDLIICLDSGCGNYDQLWMTTSLRGLFGGVLHIDVLKEGVHSGLASGIVPSSFSILRQLLDRLENAENGEVKIKEFFVDIPAERKQQAMTVAEALKDEVFLNFPVVASLKPVLNNPLEQLLNRTWRPALSVVGADGLPLPENAGNVALPSLSVKFSMRLPPTVDALKAAEICKHILESDPPFNAQVRFDITEYGSGWDAPLESEWLTKACHQASLAYFGKPAMYVGEGCSIPFMGMLGKLFPKAQFMITGVLGPGSNAHGPNEFLHIDTAKKLTCCVAEVLSGKSSHGVL